MQIWLAKQPPQQKKGSKSEKIKPPNLWKGLFPRILAVFHCINFSVAMFIGTTKLIQFNDASQPYNDAPLTNNLKSAFLHNKCTPFSGNKKSRPKSRFPIILYPSFLLTLMNKPVSLAWPQIPIFAQKPFDGWFLP